MTLTEYAQKIRDNKNNPHYLADLNLDIAADYAFISDIMKNLQLEKAVFENNTKFAGEKSLSDSAVESKWRITEGGKKEVHLKYEMKGMEKLMNAIKTSSVVNAIEARGGY